MENLMPWQRVVNQMLYDNVSIDDLREYLNILTKEKDRQAKIDEARIKVDLALQDFFKLIGADSEDDQDVCILLDSIEYRACGRVNKRKEELDEDEDYLDRLRVFADSL